MLDNRHTLTRYEFAINKQTKAIINGYGDEEINRLEKITESIKKELEIMLAK